MKDCIKILKNNQLKHLSEGKVDNTKPQHHLGFKEETCLAKICHFNPFEDTICEPMHLFFLGICKKILIHFWGVPDTPYYLKVNSNHPELDQKAKTLGRLFSLKVPSSVPRYVRSLVYIGRYSATEFRYFLFYYSYFAFKDVLPKKIL